HVAVREQLSRISRLQMAHLALQGYCGIGGLEVPTGCDRFRGSLTRVRLVIERLSLEITFLHHVPIHQSQRSHAGACQIGSLDASQRTQPDQSDPGAAQPLLPGLANLRKSHLPQGARSAAVSFPAHGCFPASSVARISSNRARGAGFPVRISNCRIACSRNMEAPGTMRAPARLASSRNGVTRGL